MAKIEDLIDEIADPNLRDRLADEVKALKETKSFGLVFEEHIPETVALFGLPIRPGAIVQDRTSPEDLTEYAIVSVSDGTAEAVPKGLDQPVVEFSTADLLVVKRFHEPVYLGLSAVGEVRQASPKGPSHIVINGENFHALELLTYPYIGKVDCIYIDPPYNTGDKSWKYNNRFVDENDSYRHSKWLSFMEKRLRIADDLLAPDGVLIVTIDENELHHLGLLIEDLFPNSRRQIVTIVINPSGASSSGLSRVEEYAIYVTDKERLPSKLGDDLLTPSTGRRSSPWESLLRRGSTWYRESRRNLCYPVLIDEQSMRIVGVGDPHPESEEDHAPNRVNGHLAAWPIRSDGRLGIWRVDGRRLISLAERGYAYVSSEDLSRGTWTVKYLMTGVVAAIEDGGLEVVGHGDRDQVILAEDNRSTKTAKTVWNRGVHTAGGRGGTQLLTALLGERGLFDYPKSVYAVIDTLRAYIADHPNALVLDFFAGSGTTLHAVAMMNSRDGGQRQCILVTNNDLSDSDASELHSAGWFAGDREFEAKGIFESVTRPRVEAALTGLRPDGEAVEGEYVDEYLSDRSYADGLSDSVVFMELDYLEADSVQLGREFNAISPLLWMAAGSVGSVGEWDGASPWLLIDDSKYGVLFDENEINDFVLAVRSHGRCSHIWLVTNSTAAFREMRSQIPLGLDTHQLYRDYMRNFTNWNRDVAS